MSLKLREIIELMCRTRNRYCFREGLFLTHVSKLTFGYNQSYMLYNITCERNKACIINTNFAYDEELPFYHLFQSIIC